MFCANCGRQIDEKAKYCPYCGAQVTRFEGNGNFGQPYVPPPVMPMVSEKKKPDGKKTAAILLAVLLFVGCALLITFIFLRRDRKDYRYYLDLGNKYLAEMKYDEAVSAFTKAIAIEPKAAEAYEGRADAYVNLQEYDLARVDYENVIEYAPEREHEIRVKLDDLPNADNQGPEEETVSNASPPGNSDAPEETAAGSTIPVLKVEEVYQQNGAGDCDMRYDRLSLGDGTDVLYPELNAALASFSDERAASIEEEYQTLLESAGVIEYDLMVYESIALGRSDENVLSVNIGYTDYSGGAHGYYSNTGASFDAKSGARLTLGDVCNDTVRLADIVADTLYSSEPDAFTSGRDALYRTILDEYVNAANNSCWVLMPEGILFYFPPYSVTFYAAGQPNALIKFADHPDLFNPTYTNPQSTYAVYASSEGADWILDDYNNDGSAEEIRVINISDGNDYTRYTSFAVTINFERVYEESTPAFEKSEYYLCKNGGRSLLMIELTFFDGTYTTYVFDILSGTAVKVDEESGGVFAGEMISDAGNPCFMESSQPDRLFFGENVRIVTETGAIESAK